MPRLLQIAQLGHPVLRKQADPINDFTDTSVRELTADMLATLAEVGGLGLASPQVYSPLRLFIIASQPTPNYPQAPKLEPFAVINPRILDRSEKTVLGWESCLSIPGLRGLVPRHRWVDVEYLAAGGKKVIERIVGFPAIIFQHEFDHLDGKVFIDRMKSTLDLVTEKEFQRLKNQLMR